MHEIRNVRTNVIYIVKKFKKLQLMKKNVGELLSKAFPP